MGSFGKRLNFFRKSLNITQVEFANALNKYLVEKINQSYITQYETDKFKPSGENLISIQKAFPVLNIDWLMTGSGEMLKKTQPKEYKVFETETNIAEEPQIKYIKLNPNNGIPYYNIDVTASNIDIFSDSQEYISDYMNVVGFKDCDFACNVAGDSMTPYLNSGDIIMCKKIKDMTFFNYGETYLIVTPEQRLVKTIRKSEKEEFVKLVSKNPEHDPFDIPKSKILNLFIVKGRIERKIL